MKELKNYRGVKEALLVGVLEGNGSDRPFEIVDYVIQQGEDGIMYTYGKVVPLTEQERNDF